MGMATRVGAPRIDPLSPDLRYLVIVERDRDVLRLHVEVEGIVAAVAADAGRLHAAERRRQMAHVLRIDPHHAGLERAARSDARGRRRWSTYTPARP